MPTPFYHLSIAEELLQKPGLSSGVLKLLSTQRAAFLLGNTAPDVQSVSGQDRQITHFFSLPILPDSVPAWERFLWDVPALARPSILAPDQAAFIAGYLCHLQADWFWVTDIFAPVFGPWTGWQTFHRRLYLHDVLRSYLDQQILPALPAGIGESLAQTSWSHWLPFVEDVYLYQWRDFLAQQLQPGAVVKTVEVFAARQGIPAEEFYQMVRSEDQMEREVFAHISRHTLEFYRQKLLVENVRLLQTYFAR